MVTQIVWVVKCTKLDISFNILNPPSSQPVGLNILILYQGIKHFILHLIIHVSLRFLLLLDELQTKIGAIAILLL